MVPDIAAARDASNDAQAKEDATRRRVEAVFALPVAVEQSAARVLPRRRRAARLRHAARHLRRVGAGRGAQTRDAVWRARYRDGSGRSLVVFLEFQSTVDTGMARRSLHTVGMAWERMRRAGTLDADRRLRSLFVVVHSGRLPWAAAGAADRVDVSAAGEVVSPTSAPYVALDARRHPRDHLPTRNLVSVLFELNGIEAAADAAAPLVALGGWLPGLGSAAEPALAAYAERAVHDQPDAVPGRQRGGNGRTADTTRSGDDSMAYSVLEDKLRQRLRESEERGIRLGEERGIRLGEERGIAREREAAARTGVAEVRRRGGKAGRGRPGGDRRRGGPAAGRALDHRLRHGRGAPRPH